MPTDDDSLDNLILFETSESLQEFSHQNRINGQKNNQFNSSVLLSIGADSIAQEQISQRDRSDTLSAEEIIDPIFLTYSFNESEISEVPFTRESSTFITEQN